MQVRGSENFDKLISKQLSSRVALRFYCGYNNANAIDSMLKCWLSDLYTGQEVGWLSSCPGNGNVGGRLSPQLFPIAVYILLKIFLLLFCNLIVKHKK